MDNNQKFLFRNILRGGLWLMLFLLAYFLVKRYVEIDFFAWLSPIFEKEFLIFGIFLLSEIIIGIIPPELFMIWAAERNYLLLNYSLVVASLAFVSFMAGVLGYLIGRYLRNTLFYRYMRKRFLRKTESRLKSFGPFLIVVAALTPVPFSGVAMLVGAIKYPSRKYLWFSLTRFLRFLIYGIIFWEARIIV